MQFDNPMPHLEEALDPDSPDALDSDASSEEIEQNLLERVQSKVKSQLNIRSILHGTFYTVLVFVLLILFLHVEFSILDNERIYGLLLLTFVLGGASTIVSSRMDEKAYNPNYVPSPYWRFIIFIFFIINEMLLLLLVIDLIEILGLFGLAALAGSVGAVNLVVLWQFVEEEFDEYLDVDSDHRTVVANYITVIIVSGILLMLQNTVSVIVPIMNVLGLFLFLQYNGFFWTYVIYDRSTINALSRIGLSLFISIMLLPLAALLLNQLGVQMTSTVIIILNFVLCTLGFLAYNARPRLKRWLYAG